MGVKEGVYMNGGSIKFKDPIALMIDDHILYVNKFNYIKRDNILILFNNGGFVASIDFTIQSLKLRYKYLKTKYYVIDLKQKFKRLKGENTMVKTKKITESEITTEHAAEEKAEKATLAVLDIGSFNIKVAGSEETYENRFTLDNESEKHGSETVTYEGNTYFFGKGKFDLTFGKAFKNIEPPLLYALGKQNIKGNVNLILHLPSSQMANKPMLVEKLQGNTFKYSVNGERSKSVTFKTVGVLKEGFSSFYALAKRNKGMICIVDIGGRTVDVFLFIDGAMTKELSVPIGTINYFKKIAERLTAETGELTETEDIHALLQHEGIDLSKYQDITDSIFSDIKNDMKQLGSLDNYQLHLCGGGAEYFEENFKDSFKKVTVMENNLTSNVDGAENIGKAKGLDK